MHAIFIPRKLSHIGVFIFIIYTVRSINGTYRAIAGGAGFHHLGILILLLYYHCSRSYLEGMGFGQGSFHAHPPGVEGFGGELQLIDQLDDAVRTSYNAMKPKGKSEK